MSTHAQRIDASASQRRFHATHSALAIAFPAAPVQPEKFPVAEPVETMAALLIAGNVCLMSRDAPLIELAIHVDRDIDMRLVHLAVSRALEMRRDAA